MYFFVDIQWYFLASIVMLTLAASDYSCPTWFFYSNTTQQCECGFESDSIHCDQQTMKVQMRVGYCVTYSGYDGVFYSGECPFFYKANYSDGLFSELPSDPELLEDAMCGTYNRKGFQCAECIDGYGPAVYSLDRACADCSKSSVVSGICLYFVVACLPITVFFICLVVFRLNITSGPMLGYVLFCQGFTVAIERYMNIYFHIQSSISTPLRPFGKIFLTIFETWNMRFMRPLIKPFCMSSKLSGIHVVLLSLVPNIVIFVLIIITFSLTALHARNNRTVVLLWWPFKTLLKKTNINISTDAVIQAFATVILISSSINNITIYALVESVNTMLSTNYTLYKTVLYFDASVEQFSSTNIYSLFTASALCIFFTIPPSILLLVYPTRIYQYLSRFISTRKQLAIMTFAETLNNCFKDGLNGTRDYRPFSGIMLIFNPLSAMWCWVIGITIASGYQYSICAFFYFSLLALVVSYMKPLKSVVANMSFSFYLTLYGASILALYYWQHKMESDFHGFVFLLIVFTAQIPVVIWVGYNTIHCVLRKLNRFS